MNNQTRRNSQQHMRLLPILAATLFFLGACASAPEAPPSSLTEAQDAIASAQQSDARQYAGAELDEAIRLFELGEGAMLAEQRIEAERFGERSRITAELAMAKTAEAKAAAVNRQMIRDADALGEEMKRTGDQR